MGANTCTLAMRRFVHTFKFFTFWKGSSVNRGNLDMVRYNTLHLVTDIDSCSNSVSGGWVQHHWDQDHP